MKSFSKVLAIILILTVFCSFAVIYCYALPEYNGDNQASVEGPAPFNIIVGDRDPSSGVASYYKVDSVNDDFFPTNFYINTNYPNYVKMGFLDGTGGREVIYYDFTAFSYFNDASFDIDFVTPREQYLAYFAQFYSNDGLAYNTFYLNYYDFIWYVPLINDANTRFGEDSSWYWSDWFTATMSFELWDGDDWVSITIENIECDAAPTVNLFQQRYGILNSDIISTYAIVCKPFGYLSQVYQDYISDITNETSRGCVIKDFRLSLNYDISGQTTQEFFILEDDVYFTDLDIYNNWLDAKQALLGDFYCVGFGIGYDASEYVQDHRTLDINNMIAYNVVNTGWVRTDVVGLGDFNLISWLGDTLGGIMDVDLIGDISLGNIIYVVLGIGFLFVVIKFFAGG